VTGHDERTAPEDTLRGRRIATDPQAPAAHPCAVSKEVTHARCASPPLTRHWPLQQARRPARGPVSPVAPRRVVVAARSRQRITASRLAHRSCQESRVTRVYPRPLMCSNVCHPRRLAAALPALYTTGRSVRVGEVPKQWPVAPWTVGWQYPHRAAGLALTRLSAVTRAARLGVDPSRRPRLGTVVLRPD
jgi:hypothetical protein